MRKWLLTLVLWVAAGAVPGNVSAVTFSVDSTADEVDAKLGDGVCKSAAGKCTLRAAVQEANARKGGTIKLPPGTYALAIPPDRDKPRAASGDLDLHRDVVITGAGTASTIVDGGGLDRVFNVHAHAHATIGSLTVRNGRARQGENGGGIANHGHLTLDNVAVTGNSTRDNASGGGIFNGATMHASKVTIGGNQTGGAGGGIQNKGILTVAESSVADNTAGGRGGGLENTDRAVVIETGIAGNRAGGPGGGVENSGKMTLTHSTVSGNRGQVGGGISNSGGLDMTEATVAGNSAPGTGGGIQNEAAPEGPRCDLRMNGVTISGNKSGAGGAAEPGGGGLANKRRAKVTLANTIVAGNSDASGLAPDCRGTILSAGYNLIQNTGKCRVAGSTTGNIAGEDPKLGPLADNGGPTQTMALLPGSPALGAGNPAQPGSGFGACEATDQRGQRRGTGPGGKTICDIGAFELSR